MSEAFLREHDNGAWAAARNAVLPHVHDVDRDAMRIWFQFFPLPLADLLSDSRTPDEVVRSLRLRGQPRLAGRRDTSHWFLYGHRYWSQVRPAIVNWAGEQKTSTVSLSDAIGEVAAHAAAAAGAPKPLLTGITAVGLMTLRQIGLPAFCAESHVGAAPPRRMASPDEIVAARKKDDSQGLFGFLRGPKTRYTVTFDERRPDGGFPLINQQDLTTAAAKDTRDYTAGDRPSREGPIPTDCRSASCGTCWIGVVGGAENLSEVEPLEARRVKEFGYFQSEETRPIIRLACQARASGNVSCVIPSWNGQIGKAGLGAL